jgi:ribose transport system permease protein
MIQGEQNVDNKQKGALASPRIESGTGSVWGTISARVDPRRIGLSASVVVMIGIFGTSSEVFLTTSNLQNVGLQLAALACIAFGQTFVIITTGFDLSVGATAALVSVVSALGFVNYGLVPGLLFGIIAGAGIGLLNGLIVTRLRVTPFITTLGTLSIASGLALNLSGGTPVTGLPETFTRIAYERLLGIPVPVLIALSLLLLAFVVLNFSRLGRHIYALGGSREAARLSGINIVSVETTVYVICSLFTVFGGWILTARVASGQPMMGGSLGLMSVAAVVLGGVSLYGGRGNVLEVAIGVLFISVLQNGLNLLGVSSYTQLMVIGAAMIIAIGWDQYAVRKWGGSEGA